MKTKKYKKEDLMFFLKENINILNKYSKNYNYNNLYNNDVLYNACVRRTNIICRLLLKSKYYLKESFDGNEIIYFANLLNLLKDFTRFHFADVWYFVFKKLPDIEIKLKRL